MRPQSRSRSDIQPLFQRFETAAFYGAFALILAVVLGTAVHPF